jgi:hypothetical protein
MADLVFFADDRATLRRWRREIEAWLWECRRLRLNERKGHVRSTELPQTYLGYRVTRQGYDLGPKAHRRFRRQMAVLMKGDPERLRRGMVAWRGAMAF